MKIERVATLLCWGLLTVSAQSFVSSKSSARKSTFELCSQTEPENGSTSDRRQMLQQSALASVGFLLSGKPNVAVAEEENMFAPGFVQSYSDFTPADGFSFRDVSLGKGQYAEEGDRVVFDWSGYTIGYFGRPFKAKGGPQGGAFDARDVDYARTVLGSGSFVKGLEKGLLGMQPGESRLSSSNSQDRQWM